MPIILILILIFQQLLPSTSLFTNEIQDSKLVTMYGEYLFRCYICPDNSSEAHWFLDQKEIITNSNQLSLFIDEEYDILTCNCSDTDLLRFKLFYDQSDTMQKISQRVWNRENDSLAWDRKMLTKPFIRSNWINQTFDCDFHIPQCFSKVFWNFSLQAGSFTFEERYRVGECFASSSFLESTTVTSSRCNFTQLAIIHKLKDYEDFSVTCTVVSECGADQQKFAPLTHTYHVQPDLYMQKLPDTFPPIKEDPMYNVSVEPAGECPTPDQQVTISCTISGASIPRASMKMVFMKQSKPGSEETLQQQGCFTDDDYQYEPSMPPGYKLKHTIEAYKEVENAGAYSCLVYKCIQDTELLLKDLTIHLKNKDQCRPLIWTKVVFPLLMLITFSCILFVGCHLVLGKYCARRKVVQTYYPTLTAPPSADNASADVKLPEIKFRPMHPCEAIFKYANQRWKRFTIRKRHGKIISRSKSLQVTSQDALLQPGNDLPANSCGSFPKCRNIALSGDAKFEKAYQIQQDLRFECQFNTVMIDALLGEGAFGRVYLGKACCLPNGPQKLAMVAIKTLKDDWTEEDLISLLKEMDLMKQLGFNQNVIQLYGVITQQGMLKLVLEFAVLGDLCTLLRKYRSFMLTAWSCPELQSFFLFQALNIAQGMVYLSSRSIIHRDLAARNILLADGCIPKIGDFGLTRRTNDYYRKVGNGRLPIKWMAPESIFEQVYTTKSDVWSYGVLLWELYSLGDAPFPTLTSEMTGQHVRDGYRMSSPQLAPRPIYFIMCECWKYKPENRPDFKGLLARLEDVRNSKHNYYQVPEIGRVSHERFVTFQSSISMINHHVNSQVRQQTQKTCVDDYLSPYLECDDNYREPIRSDLICGFDDEDDDLKRTYITMKDCRQSNDQYKDKDSGVSDIATPSNSPMDFLSSMLDYENPVFNNINNNIAAVGKSNDPHDSLYI